MKVSLFDKLAERILCLPAADRLYSEKVKKELRILHPAKEPDELYKTYYANKICLLLKVFCVGILFFVFVIISERTTSVLKDGNFLIRGETRESNRQVALEVRSEGNDVTEITYDVSPPLYSPEEIKRQVKRFSEECETLICGENESLQEVHTDLLLYESYDTYPMELEWESSDYALVNDDGTVNNEELSGETYVQLTARLIYEETEFEHTFTVCVVPPKLTKMQLWQKKILETIRAADEEQRYVSNIRLPTDIDGIKVQYAEAKESSAMVFFVLLPIVLIVIYRAKDRDLGKETEAQKRRLSLKYPEFVSKFQLLLGAGMTMRNVFARLREDKALGEELSEQLELLLRDMKNGMSVKEALDRFGKRTADPLYMKFSALLIQNMKKGTDDLLEQLSKEASEAFVLRKHHARQLGEEAGTKLLGPMILMLAVVMAVLMIPAFLSFQL